ncbi:formate/nitrite transporter family protein [Gracilibacillus oryzae]|uniref:Formate/nitrite transporter family protein n=1 Tax=Gracilibacillus oryzae TaxID=1672701 RepID=A0A7C8KPQ1_9BACI|nr:formate/nitrite transporter family protein [Gracilibacillus oryzae]KAB8132664.1 formate/nitrite transporter family protein [Gracilibacillus oryzae]
MAFHAPKKTAQIAMENGEKKVHLPITTTIILGFLAGAYISFGFLLDIRITGNLPEAIWGSMSAFIGGAVFPVGLVFVLIAGGELLTGNMMAVATARFAGKIKTIHVIKNWSIITVSNFVGSIFVAYFFGHFLGLTETGPYLDATVSIAAHKIEASFLEAFVSGVGANWLVCLAVWLCYSADDVAGKILGIWFPIMAFVAIGFQHVVANMFVIPAAIFAGYFSWWEYLYNFAAVFLGNAVGGAIFVGCFYWMAYLREKV